MSTVDPAEISVALAGTRWFRNVEVYDELPSTQALLLSEGGRDGRVVVADHQIRGRGRAGRTWVSPPGRGLLFSCLFRGMAPQHAPLLSLRAALAVARAVGEPAVLKWPNDVLISGRKVCGILGELAPDGAVVLGVGINVVHAPDELPPDVEATSLRIEGIERPRHDLLAAVLRDLDRPFDDPGWLDEYRSRCATIGRAVRVELSDGTLTGTASGVDVGGALIVDGRRVLAGDVVHVR